MVEGLQPTAEPLVLHVVPAPTARGAQVEARAMVDRLHEPGTRAHRLLTLFDDGGGPGAGVPVDFSLGRDGGRAPGVGFDPRLVPALRRALRVLSPVVVVAHGGESLKYLAPTMVGLPTPLAYYAIGTVALHAHRPARLALWRSLVRRADVVACEGPEVLEECRDLLGVAPRRLVLAPNCRDPRRFHPADHGPGDDPAPEVPVVSFVGALTTQKRPGRFVEVVAALRRRGLAFEAQIVGDGPLRDALAGPAQAAGVELLGSRRDVDELLRGSDLLVFPSLPHGEGMPGVLIEAGLSGVPVVATAAPGVRSIVDDGTTGLVVGTDDFDALVEASASLLGDGARRRAVGAAARAHCLEYFSLDVIARTWLGFLEPLFAGRRPARP